MSWPCVSKQEVLPGANHTNVAAVWSPDLDHRMSTKGPVPYRVCRSAVTSLCLPTVILKSLLLCTFCMGRQCNPRRSGSCQPSLKLLVVASSHQGGKKLVLIWTLQIAQISGFHVGLQYGDIFRKQQMLKLAIFVALPEVTPSAHPDPAHITGHTHACHSRPPSSPARRSGGLAVSVPAPEMQWGALVIKKRKYHI